MKNPSGQLQLSRYQTIVAVHLYHGDMMDIFFLKVKSLVEIAHEVWISSANKVLLDKAASLDMLRGKVVRVFEVDNKWHDWSGYLAFLRELEPSFRLVICNDSIVTRRFVSKCTINRFINASVIDRPAIVGELDTSICSIDLGGWSSACWISTYLFAVTGLNFDVPRLVERVENDVGEALKDAEHFFIRYLECRRTDVVISSDSKRSKLGAMFFERRLTRLAMENGLQIVDSFAGSRVRKVERLFERLRDA